MIMPLRRVVAIAAFALVSPVIVQARQQMDAAVVVQFQRAADSYAFRHRQAERRGAPPAPLVEGAFFTPPVAAMLRQRIQESRCEIPPGSTGNSAVPRANDSSEGTSALPACLSAVLPSLPPELEYRVSGVALLLADAHLHVIVDVVHAGFAQP